MIIKSRQTWLLAICGGVTYESTVTSGTINLDKNFMNGRQEKGKISKQSAMCAILHWSGQKGSTR